MKRAQADGFVSRAAYKLQDIQHRKSILSTKDWVLDLGAAPGSWTQLASELVGQEGLVVAVDLLECQARASNVRAIQGDFRDPQVCCQILSAQNHRLADVLLSDACATIRGIPSVDALAQGALTEELLELAPKFLRPGGALVAKIFQGNEQETLKMARQLFGKIACMKPSASQRSSREMYLIAKDLGKTAT